MEDGMWTRDWMERTKQIDVEGRGEGRASKITDTKLTSSRLGNPWRRGLNLQQLSTSQLLTKGLVLLTLITLLGGRRARPGEATSLARGAAAGRGGGARSSQARGSQSVFLCDFSRDVGVMFVSLLFYFDVIFLVIRCIESML